MSGNGIGDDTGPGLDEGARFSGPEGADDDIETEIAGSTDPAKRASIIATRDWLEFGNDLHRPNLRRTRDGATREERADDVGRAGGSLENAFDL